jgi:hypothetical protein
MPTMPGVRDVVGPIHSCTRLIPVFPMAFTFQILTDVYLRALKNSRGHARRLGVALTCHRPEVPADNFAHLETLKTYMDGKDAPQHLSIMIISGHAKTFTSRRDASLVHFYQPMSKTMPTKLLY